MFIKEAGGVGREVAPILVRDIAGRGSVEQLVSGLAFATGFSIYWYLHPQSLWPIFPIIFVGVLPLIAGIKGVVAPSMVALESSLSLDEAQAALEGMAKKGHASMQVTAEGRIVYDFSEFLPR